MITILSALVSLLSFCVRSRASLELERATLRHQVTVLRRQLPGQLRLFSCPFQKSYLGSAHHLTLVENHNKKRIEKVRRQPGKGFRRDWSS
jgi:hypothetical protein